MSFEIEYSPDAEGHFMNIIDIKDAKDSLCDYAERVKDNPLVITEDGRPIAALQPIENTDIETASLNANPKFIALIERSRLRQKTHYLSSLSGKKRGKNNPVHRACRSEA